MGEYRSEITEEFIEKNKKILNPKYINYSQKFSTKFIEKNIDWLDMEKISSSAYLTKKQMLKFEDKLNWASLVLYNPNKEYIDPKMIEKHREEIVKEISK